jgi:hypothetical protein
MATYICPMHAEVCQSGAGKCPICGMSLVPEGSRFPMLRHMLSRPLHVAVMIALMAGAMAAAMMLMR